jgi:streptogramin lyase
MKRPTGLVIALLSIGSLARGQEIVEFPNPSVRAESLAIAAGPDGNMWFTEITYDETGRFIIDTAIVRIGATGVMTKFSTPNDGNPHNVSHIATGSDGRLWFTEGSVLAIGQITTSGVFSEIPFYSSTKSITTGPDGALWFDDGSGVGRITTQGAYTHFALPSTDDLIQEITAGSDGNLWFTELVPNQIGRMTPGGDVTEFPIPTVACYPSGIAADPDGAIWFTEAVGNKIARITTDGTVTEFALPTPNGQPIGIALGADGNLWFTEELGNKIGRITPEGVITEFDLPRTNVYPLDIAAGPSGYVWVTELAGGISRLCTLENCVDRTVVRPAPRPRQPISLAPRS